MFLIILLSFLGIFKFEDFSRFIPKAESPDINKSNDLCFCRLLETRRYMEICFLRDSFSNLYGVDHIIGHSIIFDKGSTQVCYYLYEFWMPSAIEILFPEAREECTSLWVELEASETFDNTSTTISFDGKYVIPYCYGMENLYIYEIKALEGKNGGEFSMKNILTFKDKVEAVRFFKDYLIVLDSKKIIAYSMKKGKEFKKVGDFPLEHRLYTPYVWEPEVEVPTLMRAMEMDGEYLYILNPPGNDYGPLITFKISDKKIELLDDGNSFRASFHEFPYVWRKMLTLNEAHNRKYLYFTEWACGNNKYQRREVLLRLENGVPYPVEGFPELEYCELTYGCYDKFKNEFLYGYCAVAEGICKQGILYFTEDEKFVYVEPGEHGVYDNVIWPLGIYSGPDTELLAPEGRIVSCSTDELPTVEYIIFPDIAPSQNFLVMGRAYDSEGIRRVFAGFPLEPFLIRANLFQQEDGSVLFMAVLPEKGFYKFTECPQEKPYVFEAIAEDIDGDSNESPDAPYTRDFLCLSFKEEKDPLPIGEVEICPYEYARNIYINGWALDNNGIKGGWLFSEDANVLVPINYGKERKDIKDKYPEYPDSLHSGFEVSYDLSNIGEGEYEFYVRILAKDYQVIDFGPYKISIPKHKRPF